MRLEKGAMVDPKIRRPNTGNGPRSVARHSLAVLLATTALGVVSAHAVNGTWVGGNGGDPSEWVEPANWSGAVVPDGVATFTNTGVTTVANDNGVVAIGEVLFTAAPNAQAYTININNPFIVNGSGIVNNSTNTQTFNVSSGNALVFQSASTASGGTGAVTINNQNGGFISFQDTSTAGTATIVNDSILQFSDTSTAGSAHITNNLEMDFFQATSAGSSVITNAATGTLTFNNTATASTATINNSGAVQFNNSSTAGGSNITNANGATIDFFNSSGAGSATFTNNVGGVITFHDTSAAGSASFTNNGSLIFANTNSITVSGVIGGGGTLTMAGPGTLILSNTDTYSGATTVNGGTLIVDGSTALSSTTVNPGGTLAGSGTVGNTDIAGGTLAPGSAGGSVFGPLTVQGNLSFTAASTYMIQVSPANASRTNVSGTATLNGATVNAVFLPGSYVNRQYTIVNATGGVSGTFNPAVVSNMANIQSTLTYDANDAFLNIKLSFVPPPSGSLNVNQQNVANTLTNFFNATGSIPAAFAALGPAGLTIASGELGTGVIQSSIKADDLFLNLLLDPTIAGRAGGFAAPGGGASQFTADDEAAAYAAMRRASPSERDAYAMVTKAPLLAAPPVNRWSVWGSAYGGSETVGGNAVVGSQDTKASVYGLVAGADYKVSPDTLLGFALAGGHTGFSLANGLGSGSADLFQAGAFGRHNFGPAYISAALAYGWHDVTTNRTVLLAGIDQLQGRFRAETFSGRLEGGYRFATPMMGITPYAAVQVLSFNLPAYAEQVLAGAGTFALNYAAQTTTDTRTELGLRSDKSFAMQDAVLTLRGRAAWAHDYNPNRAVTALFQALPGANFAVNGARPDADSALVSAGAEMKWLNGFSLGATFEGEFSGNVTSYAGKGVARYTW
jgi:autotransporter-associated beta strand protein